MNLLSLSKALPVSCCGMSFTPPEVWRIKFGKKEKTQVEKWLAEFRTTNFPDKGFSFDLTSAQILSEDVQKMLVFLADNVASENVIGMDVYINHKPSDNVKKVVEMINHIILTKGTNAIRIKKDRYRESIKRWQWALIVGGALFVVAGAFLGLQTFEKGDWKIETNATQIIGGVFILIGILPILARYKEIILKKETSNHETIN